MDGKTQRDAAHRTVPELSSQLADKLHRTIEIVLFQPLFKLLAVSALEAVAGEAGLNAQPLLLQLDQGLDQGVCSFAAHQQSGEAHLEGPLPGCHREPEGVGMPNSIYAEEFAAHTGIDHACR